MHVHIHVLNGESHITPNSVLLVKACHMDKSKVKEQRNIILFTGGIAKYMDIGSGKELRPLTQCITRVITYFHAIKENRAYR